MSTIQENKPEVNEMQVSNIVITDAIVALALEDNRDTRVAKALALLKYYRENKMKGDQS